MANDSNNNLLVLSALAMPLDEVTMMPIMPFLLAVAAKVQAQDESLSIGMVRLHVQQMVLWRTETPKTSEPQTSHQ